MKGGPLMGPKTQQAHEAIHTASPWDLSGLSYGDCGSPDRPDSAGAVWLRQVRDSALEAWTWAEQHDDTVDRVETAGEAVPVYTYEVWRVFADLAGWQVDGGITGPSPSSWYTDGEDFTEQAQLRLYRIARRIVRVICRELDQAAAEDLEAAEDATVA
jgi:hypothetical protein